MKVILDDSPFPKGMTVFDDGAEDDDESSPLDDDFVNGYEVICAREIVQIPVQVNALQEPGAQTILGQGAQFMMGQASKVIGSFFSK